MAAITAAEIVLRYSIKTGSAGNSTASAPLTSLGKYISTTAWPSPGALNDLFDDISGAENAASVVEYRCIFVYNSNGANNLQNAVVWVNPETAGGANIAIAIDNLPASAIASASAQAAEIATEATIGGPGASAGAFSTPTSQATGLSLGTINPGQCRAFWVRRSATASSALSNDGGTINVAGDTGNL
jgi:hypothetical protein